MKISNHFIVKCLPLVLWMACSHKAPSYWPGNGTVFQDKSWGISISDSMKVLVKNEGHWILPEPPRGVQVNRTESMHRKPKLKQFNKQLGRVDQEVVYDLNDEGVEFYRFEKNKVMLLGMSNPDTAYPIVLFDPPLVAWPGYSGIANQSHESEVARGVWNRPDNRFEAEQKTRIHIVFIEQGMVRLGLNDFKAVLCDIRISDSGMSGSDGSGLTAPDAMYRRNKVLMVEGVGPVLEWGIRSGSDEAAEGQEKKGASSKYYIEVTLHQRIE